MGTTRLALGTSPRMSGFADAQAVTDSTTGHESAGSWRSRSGRAAARGEGLFEALREGGLNPVDAPAVVQRVLSPDGWHLCLCHRLSCHMAAAAVRAAAACQAKRILPPPSPPSIPFQQSAGVETRYCPRDDRACWPPPDVKAGPALQGRRLALLRGEASTTAPDRHGEATPPT